MYLAGEMCLKYVRLCSLDQGRPRTTDDDNDDDDVALQVKYTQCKKSIAPPIFTSI